VKVRGYWYDPELTVVITDSALCFLQPGALEPTKIRGINNAGFEWVDPITTAIFQLGP
jgi:hypothetical protein